MHNNKSKILFNSICYKKNLNKKYRELVFLINNWAEECWWWWLFLILTFKICMRKTKFKSAVLHKRMTSHNGRYNTENAIEIKTEVHSCANSFHPSPFSNIWRRVTKNRNTWKLLQVRWHSWKTNEDLGQEIYINTYIQFILSSWWTSGKMQVFSS